LFENLEGGNLKYFGVALYNIDWRLKNLRGYESGEMHTAASYLPPFRKLPIAV
jgi:hypothetical protein